MSGRAADAPLVAGLHELAATGTQGLGIFLAAMSYFVTVAPPGRAEDGRNAGLLLLGGAWLAARAWSLPTSRHPWLEAPLALLLAFPCAPVAWLVGVAARGWLDATPFPRIVSAETAVAGTLYLLVAVAVFQARRVPPRLRA